MQTYLTAREAEIQAFEDTPSPVVAKLAGISAKTVRNHRASIARKQGMPLSNRESEILLHCSRGCALKEIAQATGLAEKTVKTHKANARAKLGEAGWRREVFKNG